MDLDEPPRRRRARKVIVLDEDPMDLEELLNPRSPQEEEEEQEELDLMDLDRDPDAEERERLDPRPVTPVPFAPERTEATQAEPISVRGEPRSEAGYYPDEEEDVERSVAEEDITREAVAREERLQGRSDWFNVIDGIMLFILPYTLNINGTQLRRYTAGIFKLRYSAAR